MAYFWGIFFSDMGGGGGQKYSQERQNDSESDQKVSQNEKMTELLLPTSFCGSLKC